MKKVTVEFTISTMYINSEVKETKVFEFDEEDDKNCIEEVISEAYADWVHEKNKGGWTEISSETVPDDEEE